MCPSTQEHRCTTCHKLLFKGILIEGEVEIKCRSCHNLTRVSASKFDRLLCLVDPCPHRVTVEGR